MIVLGTLLIAHGVGAGTIDGYNVVAGTQAIGGAYQFTQEPALVEAARAIRAMGSDTIKFSLTPERSDPSDLSSLTEVARRAPSAKAVLDMPFQDYLMWAYPVSTKKDRFSLGSLAKERKEIYDLTRYLLKRYEGTGKSFYLGNWEGDWHLTHTDPNRVPKEMEVRNMTAWIKARQGAVDDAKRDTPHHGVQVWLYLEVNRVEDAIAGKTRLTNAVLPHTPVDFVSYSCYDALDDPSGRRLTKALDYIASKLPPKAGVSGRRVFIGEYGFPAKRFSPEEQDARSRGVLRTALRWGCRFALYWQLYNNEVEAGKQVGYWMINDKGKEQPILTTHRRYYAWARGYLTDFKRRVGRLPSRAEFGKAAVAFLDAR